MVMSTRSRSQGETAFEEIKTKYPSRPSRAKQEEGEEEEGDQDEGVAGEKVVVHFFSKYWSGGGFNLFAKGSVISKNWVFFNYTIIIIIKF